MATVMGVSLNFWRMLDRTGVQPAPENVNATYRRADRWQWAIRDMPDSGSRGTTANFCRLDDRAASSQRSCPVSDFRKRRTVVGATSSGVGSAG
ncbi:MAG: hypothetical protein ABL908_15825, partial [Hyphomicrobium sp.]